MKINFSIRKVPAPYQAMLSICSDLDETPPDKSTYFEISKYLNTTQQTAIGKGVGLEVGNSIYFDMPKSQFSYWNADEYGRSKVRELIRSGFIDCLHSFGDLAINRSHAQRALSELSQHDCKLKVWVDHAQAPSNFGGDIMHGYGDVLGSDIYHADITTQYGIKYVWCGRVTSVIGQNVVKDLRGIANYQHPFISAKTLLKEIMKYFLAKMGSVKYSMHANNNILRKYTLRSGQEVIEFMRSNPFWGGVGLSATSSGLAFVLTGKFLDHLISRGAATILYTHLGKIYKHDELFSSRTKDALMLLSQYYKDKKILVTTTKRLLDYHMMLEHIKYKISYEHGKVFLFIEWEGDISDLEGLSFIGNAKHVQIYVNGSRLENVHYCKLNNNYCYYLNWNQLDYPLK